MKDNKKIHYGEKVDKHIYNIKNGCQTSLDWIDLVFAAMDQAGFSEKYKNTIYNELVNVAERDGLFKE